MAFSDNYSAWADAIKSLGTNVGTMLQQKYAREEEDRKKNELKLKQQELMNKIIGGTKSPYAQTVPIDTMPNVKQGIQPNPQNPLEMSEVPDATTYGSPLGINRTVQTQLPTIQEQTIPYDFTNPANLLEIQNTLGIDLASDYFKERFKNQYTPKEAPKEAPKEVTFELSPGEKKYSFNTITGGTKEIAHNAPLPQKKKEIAPTELSRLLNERNELVTKNPSDPNIKVYDDKIKKETTTQLTNDVQNDFNSWSDEEKEFWYDSNLTTGQKPNWGYSRAATQSSLDFQKGYANYMNRLGITQKEGVAIGEEYKSDVASLRNLIKGSDAVKTFEKGVENSFEIIENLSDKLKRSKIPLANNIFLWMKKNSGSSDVKPFKNAVVTAMTEYMKVTTAGTGISSSELSVRAQDRAYQLLSESDNVETFKKSIEVMRQETKGKLKAFDGQISEIRKRLRGDNSPSPTKPEKSGRGKGDPTPGQIEKMSDEQLQNYLKTGDW